MMNLEDMENRLKTRFPDAEVKLADMTGTGDHIFLEIQTSEFEGMPRTFFVLIPSVRCSYCADMNL